MHVWGPTTTMHIFGIVHFKTTHTRHPKTLLVVRLVQMYACSERHPQNAHFLALCISNTPVLGIQNYFWWHIWCKSMHVQSATPRVHIFCHRAFQKHPYQGSKNTFGGMFGAKVCTFGAPPPQCTFLALCVSKTPIPGIGKHFWWCVWCRGMHVQGATPQNAHVLALRISNTPLLGIQKYFWWHICCRSMHVQGATPRVHIFGILYFKHTHTRYPKTLLAVCFVQRYAHLARQPKSAHFLALCISNASIPGIQKHFWSYVWCKGMHVQGATPKMHILWHCAFQIRPC